ncbi:helix-turn-helix domain-containing protein [Brevibacillus halotolerans]|uniref:helix-turn-helix domain-containing protein n=1 Tax=Brevibacillus halotolerans TaxID=1507437 RepID=UPI0015EF3F9B|nr:helix-turn-helix domain-containing protein [Brevibacillus halotolerans]MBA4535503.1 replication protein [Brevibacillus halotolerans]
MKKDKTIVRVIKRENPFVQIDKTPINDERLSWKAKGLLVYLISKPDNWTVVMEDLIKKAKDGRDSVKAGLRELEAAGYISRRQSRDENGKFDKMEFLIYEVPQTFDNTDLLPEAENPPTGKSVNGKSVNGKSVNGKSVNGKSATTNNDFNKNHLPNNDFNNISDDELLIKGGEAPHNNPSPYFAKNKEIIDAFVEYAVYKGIHKDFANEIKGRLEQVDFELSHSAIGKVVNKIADSKEISHIPNYFMTVLANEIKQEQMKGR